MTGFTWRCWKENNALGIAVEILLRSKRLQRKARPTEASAKVGNAHIKNKIFYFHFVIARVISIFFSGKKKYRKTGKIHRLAIPTSL